MGNIDVAGAVNAAGGANDVNLNAGTTITNNTGNGVIIANNLTLTIRQRGRQFIRREC